MPTATELDELCSDATELLRELIATPSFSREETATADLIASWLDRHGLRPRRHKNNIWALAEEPVAARPILLLNSHHDTVRPVDGWTRDPHLPFEQDGRLFGLGSNDAGASLVALLAAFHYLADQPARPVNLLLAATAEEEISGPNGIADLLPHLPPLWAGIVGEPTQMDMAIAEKGLMVIDGEARGQAGHAAREEGVNALYIALDDIDALRRYRFEKESPLLGPVKVSVTRISAGRQHNVVPDRCRFVIDVRTNELYSNREAYDLLQQQCRSTLRARSFRLNSSRIDPEHPLVASGRRQQRPTYGSPTLSDQALLSIPTLKMGPGDSARSHTADEFIYLEELRAGIDGYIRLIQDLRLP